MADYVLTCCSTADLPREQLAARDIRHICFHYDIDGVDHVDDLYASTTPEQFYAVIKGGAQPKTSQPGAGEYVEFWEPVLKDGKDVLHVTLSSGISGAYNSACLARDQLAGAYPERRVVVVDSLAASTGYGMLMEYAADQRDAGLSLDEAVAWLEEHKLELNHWFYVSDLECLKRGGRVSATSALLANALKICPVMNVDYQGCLAPREKIRTKRRAMARLVDAMMEHVQDGGAYTGRCMLTQSDCEADARAVADMVEERVPALRGKVEIHPIGTVIGSHTGPGTVGLFFMGDRRVD